MLCSKSRIWNVVHFHDYFFKKELIYLHPSVLCSKEWELEKETKVN